MSLNLNEIVIVLQEDLLCRIDSFLNHKFPLHSRTYFQFLLEEGSIKVNGKEVKKREKLQIGDRLDICFKQKHPIDNTPQEMALEILYEDEYLLAINKPRNLVVHPAPGHPSNTLVNGLLFRYQNLRDQNTIRPGIVHRLDKDTSGVMLIAKTDQAHQKLSEAFKERRIQKEYLALCLGNPGSRTIHNRLGRDLKNRKKFAVVENGKEAISKIELLHFRQGYSLVKILPETGRTHQIRVHLQSIGCPILGDPLYSSTRVNEKVEKTVQMLHAHSLRFTHPFTGKELHFIAKTPEDMSHLLAKLLNITL